MKQILLTHIILFIVAVGTFFSLGWIDKARFDQASLSHKPKLLFSHSKHLMHDGGSIHWESVLYYAHESRRMRVWEEHGETQVANGFQKNDSYWRWEYRNLIWICLMIGASFTGAIFTFLKMNPEQQKKIV